jgi:hypothetical protein
MLPRAPSCTHALGTCGFALERVGTSTDTSEAHRTWQGATPRRRQQTRCRHHAAAAACRWQHRSQRHSHEHARAASLRGRNDVGTCSASLVRARRPSVGVGHVATALATPPSPIAPLARWQQRDDRGRHTSPASRTRPPRIVCTIGTTQPHAASDATLAGRHSATPMARCIEQHCHAGATYRDSFDTLRQHSWHVSGTSPA